MCWKFLSMWLELVITAREAVADGVLRFELRDPSGTDLLPAAPGAHLQVRLPGDQVRHYSLTGNVGRRDAYTVAVLRETAGTGGSAHIHDAWNVGAVVTASEPINHFPLSENTDEAILIAGGIGITPILAMAGQLAHDNVPFQAIHIAGSRPRAAFAHDLARLTPPGNLLQAFEGRNSPGLDLAVRLAVHRPGRHLYVCGPIGLIQEVRAAAGSWPAGSVHFEAFVTAEQASGADTAFEVEIASTGAVFEVKPGATILDVLEKHGIRPPSLCREGYCGTCLVGVSSGVPDHRDTVLSEEERAAGREIAICCSRAKTRRLVLDL